LHFTIHISSVHAFRHQKYVLHLILPISVFSGAKDPETRRMIVLNGTGLFFLTPVSPVPLYQTSFLTSIIQSSDHQSIIKSK
ncbi:hypothetical protein D917_07302, partial [Trichinella nativa]